MVEPAARREAVVYLIGTYQVSTQRSCRLMQLKRSSYYYKAHPRDDSVEREALKEAAQRRRKWGYRNLRELLSREGLPMNHKKVERIYSEEGLQLSKRKKKKASRWRGEKAELPTGPNERWSMDFVHDRLRNGRKVRALTIVDDYTRECLWIEVDYSLSGYRVTEVLNFLVKVRATPAVIVTDNGPEFTGQTLDQWAYEHGVRLHFIEPGKPVQNAFVERFNGTFRYECLNDHWFRHLNEAQTEVHKWREDYNHHRPHSSLGYLTPMEFAGKTPSPAAAGDGVDQQELVYQ